MLVVQSKKGDSVTTSVASLGVTLTNPVTAGNGLLVFAAVYDVTTTLTISDGVNTYTNIISYYEGGSYRGYAWYCHTAEAGSPTITVTVGTGTKIIRLAVIELSGHLKAAGFDDARNSFAYSSSTPSGAAITTTSAGMAFMYVITQSGFSVTSWTAPWEIVGTNSDRSALAKTLTEASTLYTPSLTFAAAESGQIMCVNVAKETSSGITKLIGEHVSYGMF